MTPEMVQMANAKLLDFIKSQNFGSIEEINQFLNKQVNGKRIDEIIPLKKGRKSNIEMSEELMYQAYECDAKKANKLVHEALKLNPENVRAITYLGDSADNITMAIKLFEQAVSIGHKQLGDDFFKENKGHFWVMFETRPYMTARLKYAECLEVMGKKEEAIKEYSALLELNPNDNQGIRFILSSMLLFYKKYNAYFELYKKFNDEISTFWLFNYALFLFATEGASEKAHKTLIQANECNKHIFEIITGSKKIKSETSSFYSPGDEREASYYLLDNFKSWENVTGAIDWILNFLSHLTNNK